MKKEEVKYVYQEPLLVDKLKKKDIYKETTMSCPQSDVATPATCNLSRRHRIVLSVAAVVSSLLLIAMVVGTLVSVCNERQRTQDEAIGQLKEALETQQTRLHRMQKELQFLVSRQQASDGRHESLRRRQGSVEESIIQPIQQQVAMLEEEEIDVDQLPVAPANKRRGGKSN